jgi:Glycosyltransferase Family 4
MRVLLLNQYGFASGAPTGRILAELGDGLRQRGHDVVFLQSDESYGQSRRGVRRILHELRAHAVLAGRGLLGGRIDAVISLTSPACLAITAGAIARVHRARHFHWAMDLYPDVGVRLGEVREGALTRLLAFLMQRAYRTAHRVVALDEDMRDHLRAAYRVDSTVLEPFPPEVAWPADATTTTRRWLYSGNFGRAHEIDVLLQVQKRLEQSGIDAELIFQGHGARFASSRDSAAVRKLRHVHWRPPVEQELLGQSLLDADVLVVTRKAEMKGLLLPSKLMLAELSGRAVLWIGDTDSHTARRLKKAGHGVFAMDEVESIASWLGEIFGQKSSRPATKPRATRDVREQSIRAWEALLES